MKSSLKTVFIRGVICFGIFIGQAAGRTNAQNALTYHPSDEAYHLTLDMQIPCVPAPEIIGGKPILYYELHLVNYSTDSLALEQLDVFDLSDSSLLVSIGKSALETRYVRIGTAGTSKDDVLTPGGAGIIYIEVALPQNHASTRLGHCLRVTRVKKGGGELIPVWGAVTSLSAQPPVILGPPLEGAPWAAIYDPSWEHGHRRVIYTVDGRARIPGRFAIDFIRLDERGRYAAGNGDSIRNWLGYGAAVLAVADGMIAAVRDGFPESPTLSGHTEAPAGEAAGNFIALQIGDSRFVFYEHLRPGSLRVKPGQRVKKGEVIAALGYTGQTTGPHLHLHVADRSVPLGGEGIPYSFQQFILLGEYPDMGKFGKEPWIPAAKTPTIREERPPPCSVIRFDP
jgi:murein DD-endopeptidase